MHSNPPRFPYPKGPFQYQVKPGYIRILHTVSDAGSVDVYANGTLIAQNLSFGTYTKYLTLMPGMYEIEIYITNSKGNPLLTDYVEVTANLTATLIAGNTLENIELYLNIDGDTPLEPGQSMIRFSHFSPNAPAVDIALSDGTLLFPSVTFTDTTPYVAVAPMTYHLQVKIAGTPMVVLTVPGVMLQQNMFYTIYAIGLVGGEPTLQPLLLMDKHL